MSPDVQSEASVDPVAVISLVRQLLPVPGESLNTPQTSDHQSASGEQTTEANQENAGCLLWDLATLEEAAIIMADNYICDILPVIMEHGSDRLVEISTGILGNLACHDTLKARLLTAPIRGAILEVALWRNNSGCLTEVCRLLSSLLYSHEAHEWLQDVLQFSTLERIAWIMENTLNNTLFERACQLISPIASTSSEAVSALIRHPFLGILANCLQQSTQMLAEHGTGGSGWDSPSTAVDDETFPGPNAIQAAFDALEAVAEDTGGAKAIVENQQLVASLLSLQQAPVDLSVRGRAAALVAELDAEEFHRPVVQDAGAMRMLLSMVVTASSDEDYGEACWALLAAVARFMQTDQPPLEVLCEIAEGSQELVRAGIQQLDRDAQEESNTAGRRVAYTFRQLAALMEQYASQLAHSCPPEAQTGDQTKSGPAESLEQLQGEGRDLGKPHSGKARIGSNDQEQEKQQHLPKLRRAHANFQAAAEHAVSMQCSS